MSKYEIPRPQYEQRIPKESEFAVFFYAVRWQYYSNTDTDFRTRVSIY